MDNLRDFLTELENEYKVIEVDEEISLKYQVAQILRNNPHDVILHFTRSGGCVKEFLLFCAHGF